MNVKEELRKRKVYNEYEFYGNQPYIWYRPRGDSRSMTSPGWMVSKRGMDLSDHWSDQGACFFGAWKGADRKVALAEAIKWASEKFGIKEWKRDPFGCYGPAEYVDRRLKELLSHPAEGSSTVDVNKGEKP